MNCTQCNDLLFDYIEGLINDQDKHALKAHIRTCDTCQSLLKDLQALQTRLTEHGQNLAQIELEIPVLGAIVRRQKQQLKAITPPSPQLRRPIMKSPITKLAIAAMVIMGCVLGITMWSGTQSIALADVLTRMEQARAYLYKMNMTITQTGDLPAGYPPTQEVESTILIAPEYGMKMTMKMGMIANQTMVQEQYLQPQNKRMLMIMPDQKKYMEMELTDQLADQYKKQNNDPRMMIETFLNCDYEKIGRSKITGIQVEGFRTTDPSFSGALGGKTNITLWVDSRTRLPVQMDMDMDMSMGAERTMHIKGIMTDFQWDVPVDTSVFEPVIPDDYTSLASSPIKMPEMTEETAIVGLKQYLDYAGQYPEDLSLMRVMSGMGKLMDSNTPASKALKQSIKGLNQNDMTKAMMDMMMPIQATVGFYARLAQEKKDPAYYGDIVTPDQPDLILMRWQIEDGQYRVIFSDLTAETVTPQQLTELESVLPQKESE
ncbi:MAG: zf-HC2 domain-containing protein [Phycisphaerae bacterium]|nr:zf-HC2 domain-containing protein [Phycisphaerae bacterium]